MFAIYTCTWGWKVLYLIRYNCLIYSEPFSLKVSFPLWWVLPTKSTRVTHCWVTGFCACHVFHLLRILRSWIESSSFKSLILFIQVNRYHCRFFMMIEGNWIHCGRWICLQITMWLLSYYTQFNWVLQKIVFLQYIIVLWMLLRNIDYVDLSDANFYVLLEWKIMESSTEIEGSWSNQVINVKFCCWLRTLLRWNLTSKNRNKTW